MSIPRSGIENISRLVEDCISTFGLFRRNERLLVAFSGGKDSTLIAHILRELGYDVTLVAVDMAYEAGWSGRIAGLAASLKLDIATIPVTARAFKSKLEPKAQVFLEERLTVLGSPPSYSSFTPCTHCYNSKVVGLQWAARELAADHIVFGHHLTDASSSLLKSALMYIDRWDKGNREYRRASFQSLVTEIENDLAKLEQVSSRSPDLGAKPCSRSLLSRVEELVTLGVAATDEAPVQDLDLTDLTQTNRDSAPLRIVRPLFRVREEDIIDAVDALGHGVEGSGCGHSASASLQTPRELVHFGALRKARNWAMQGEAAYRYLSDLIEQGVAEDGRLRRNVRNQRQQLLGPEYKPSLGWGQKL